MVVTNNTHTKYLKIFPTVSEKIGFRRKFQSIRRTSGSDAEACRCLLLSTPSFSTKSRVDDARGQAVGIAILSPKNNSFAIRRAIRLPFCREIRQTAQRIPRGVW